MSVKTYFIQYKFILPESIKHSSYTYQKLFRALYGYTQTVTKSNGKKYTYYRPGILSNVPYIRPGKNCVIIPTTYFSTLVNFFKTGKNPSHYWGKKGDWKAVYYMDEKDLESDKLVPCMEALLERKYIINLEGDHTKLLSELYKYSNNVPENQLMKNYFKVILDKSDEVIKQDWFRESVKKSQSLTDFHKNYNRLKQNYLSI